MSEAVGASSSSLSQVAVPQLLCSLAQSKRQRVRSAAEVECCCSVGADVVFAQRASAELTDASVIVVSSSSSSLSSFFGAGVCVCSLCRCSVWSVE